jgi:hypothetical protein
MASMLAALLRPRGFFGGVTSTVESASAVDCSLSPSHAGAAASDPVAVGAGAAVIATGPLQPLDDRQQFDKVSAAASSRAHRNTNMPTT